LVLHEPLTQAPHDASPTPEIDVSPRFLSVGRETDFVSNLLLAVGLEGVEVHASGWVKAGDITRALYGHGRREGIVLSVGIQVGVFDDI